MSMLTFSLHFRAKASDLPAIGDFQRDANLIQKSLLLEQPATKDLHHLEN